MKKILYIPLALLMVLGMIVTMTVAVPPLLFTIWHEYKTRRQPQEDRASGPRSPWLRTRS
jgi:hypothetical protein